ncbi:hypothetical protein [Paenibacillus sp. GCM10027626]|uniref:hypothetical protein n=1 Tax=Paenibacillus sp. GCM10027626 TaxID=3273411 RepID=UPI0036388E70
MKKVVSFLLTAAIMLVVAVPFAAAKPSAMSLLQACKITVDKQVLFIKEDDEARTATIKLACDPNKVDYSDISYSLVGGQVDADAEGREIKVTAVKGGAGFVKIEHDEYIAVKIRFRVFSTFDKETPEQRVKPELSNKQKALIADYKSYMIQVSNASEHESRALDAYNNNRYVDSSNKSAVYAVFNKQVVPNYSKFLYSLKLIKPKTAELTAIHKNVLQHAQLRFDGFSMMKQSMAGAKLNSKMYDQGYAKVNQGTTYSDKAVDQLDKLSDKLLSLEEEL